MMQATVTQQPTISELVDQLAQWDKLLNEAKEQIEKIQNKIQEYALQEMWQRKVKTLQYFGNEKNYVTVTMARKVELLNYPALERLFTSDVIHNFIVEDKEPRYKMTKQFKEIAAAVFFGEFTQNPLEHVLREMGMDDSQTALATKKLKGDYVKDKALLKSLGFDGEEIDSWLVLIHQSMNFQKIKNVLQSTGHESNSAEFLEMLKNSVFVEETPKITVRYEE